MPQPAGQLGVRPGDPGRGVVQPLAVGVLADRDQQLADGGLGARVVERRGPRRGRARAAQIGSVIEAASGGVGPAAEAGVAVDVAARARAA